MHPRSRQAYAQRHDSKGNEGTNWHNQLQLAPKSWKQSDTSVTSRGYHNYSKWNKEGPVFEEAAEQEEQMMCLHLLLMSRNLDFESSGELTLDLLAEWPFCAVVPVLAAPLG
jgi:hypothetical protein